MTAWTIWILWRVSIFNHFVVVEIEVSPERENIILQMSGSLHLISSSTDLEKLNEKRKAVYEII